jgi:hypothetical protein
LAYTTLDGQRQLLDALAAAIEELALAIAAVSEAYEQVDEAGADRIEESLFRPLQSAYGTAKRAHSDFASRSGLQGAAFAPAPSSAPGAGARSLLERAVERARAADVELAELQDSMLPVEVGDPQLRADLSAVRIALDQIGRHARELLRTLGR